MSQSRGHVAVTGAGGFVCSALALALSRAGWRVTAVDRAFDAEARGRLAGLDLVEADLLTEPGVLDGIAPSALVHGAALTVAPERIGMTRAEHVAINTQLLIGAMRSVRRAGAADRMLFLSSTGVFDGADGIGQDRLTEEIAATGQGPYAAAKRAGEEITTGAAEPGFATLTVRLGNVFGPHETTRSSRQHLSLPHRMKAEAPSGEITSGCEGAVRDWAWLPDLADGLAALLGVMLDMEPGVIHAGTPPVICDEAMAERIAPGTRRRFAMSGPLRPPMGSVRPSPLQDIQWTPVEKGLQRLGLSAAGA